MQRLNAGPVPLYQQLKSVLKDDIERGVYKSGDRLPSEPDLIREYGISRITVRQALDDLEVEGLIVRRHGKGTYVAERQIEQELVRLTDFVEDMQRAGQIHHRACWRGRMKQRMGLSRGRFACQRERRSCG